MKKSIAVAAVALMLAVAQLGAVSTPAAAGSNDQWVRFGIGLAAQGLKTAIEADRREQRRKEAAAAAERERQRTAKCMAQKACRAKLQREAAARKEQQRRNERALKKLFAGGTQSRGSSSRSSSGSTCGPHISQERCDYENYQAAQQARGVPGW